MLARGGGLQNYRAQAPLDSARLVRRTGGWTYAPGAVGRASRARGMKQGRVLGAVPQVLRA